MKIKKNNIISLNNLKKYINIKIIILINNNYNIIKFKISKGYSKLLLKKEYKY